MRLLLHFAFAGWFKLHFRRAYWVMKLLKKNNPEQVASLFGLRRFSDMEKCEFKVMLGISFPWSKIQIKSNLIAPFSFHWNQRGFWYATIREWKQDFEKYMNQRSISKQESHSSMYPALLEGRFCILHETKYLPAFHCLKCRAETTNERGWQKYLLLSPQEPEESC